MLHRMSIPHKFILVCSLLSFLIIMLTVANAIRLSSMGHHITSIENHDIPLTKIITAITEHQLEQEIYFEQAFRFALELKEENDALLVRIEALESQ